LRPGRASWTLRPSCSGRTSWTLRAWHRRSCSGWALRTSGPLNTLWSLRTSRTGISSRSLRSSRPGSALRTCRPSRSGRSLTTLLRQQVPVRSVWRLVAGIGGNADIARSTLTHPIIDRVSRGCTPGTAPNHARRPCRSRRSRRPTPNRARRHARISLISFEEQQIVACGVAWRGRLARKKTRLYDRIFERQIELVRQWRIRIRTVLKDDGSCKVDVTLVLFH
jgi:hypothetical protein